MTSAFALPERRAAKADPDLIATDERHFAAIAACLDQRLAELADRLAELRRAPAGSGQEAMDRDSAIHRLSARRRMLQRFGLDLCLGRMVPDGGEPVYVGRLGLTDAAGRRLLVDWRAPAAEPFFGATHADAMGLVSRRRYHWTGGRVTDYWDEVFTADGLAGHAALDDQSAFLASLAGSRTARMRDVLGTIAADQDAIIRAGSAGTLVVDGGPGTGKTVVALHRTAYLLYSDPRLGHHRGGVLVVGPHRPYLDYVSDVLPSLGEEGVQLCTLRDLVPQGAGAGPEGAEVAALKADARLVAAIEPAVRFHENPPTAPLVVATPWADVRLSAADWADAFGVPEPGTPHNDARDEIWEALVDILVDALREQLPCARDDTAWSDGELDEDRALENRREDEGFDAYGLAGRGDDAVVRRAFAANRDLVRAFGRAWPVLEATDVVGDLWTVPAYLRLCAPWLTAEQVRTLQRDVPDAWTEADLPLLDAARLRLGDPEASRRRRRREAAAAESRERMSDVVDDLIAADDSELHVMSMLRGQDLRAALVDADAVPADRPDRLAGPFAHVVVDEAQELTDAQWQMLLARCPSRSFTVVGDRAQARHGFAGSWQERLGWAGLDRVRTASLTLNYRTPSEVMAQAEPVIRAVLPDANVPTSVRTGGVPVRYGAVAELADVLRSWLAEHAGVACVVATSEVAVPDDDRVRVAAPELVKGLEFDLVVLVEPERFGTGVQGAVDRYVAMTRATERLVVLTG
ncbi:RNA polymerase recycling motor ATPase HelR [Isoptericola sp. b441]|uniref:RNA polymerase recycling motor ATPase HelR n=1 Tax=Actinotalea lenta TaxID=3064654 RepID=A0ABT9D771_9CELL|nr:RNA polymerase recycling motor ATPase HelR [Isoptericola sp. b441]MDO8106700.1 RNA polymerase recycling motor ATPase HelR [Isoptericola sp. b441]